MATNEQVLQVIYDSIEDVNSSADADRQIDKTPDTALFGSQSKLDSLGMVNLIVAIEGRVEETFNKSITLADELAMSQRNSPFRNVQTLADYIVEKLSAE